MGGNPGVHWVSSAMAIGQAATEKSITISNFQGAKMWGGETPENLWKTQQEPMAAQNSSSVLAWGMSKPARAH